MSRVTCPLRAISSRSLESVGVRMGVAEEFIQMCCKLFPDEEIRCTLQGALGGGTVAGTAATVGGVLAGPPGLLMGGTVGGLMGYLWYKDGFKPLPQVLAELSPEERQKLYDHVWQNLQWTDLAQLLSRVMAQPEVKKQLLQAIKNFFS